MSAPQPDMAATGLTILVADDDPVSRRLVSGALRRRFTVVEAADGVEAVERFVSHRPDLALLDVNMPRMTGVEATERIRQLEPERFVPILLFSALDEVSTLVDGLRRGADDFLPKPFNPQVFNSKLNVFLRIRGMQAKLTEQMGELTRYRDANEQEHALAQALFDRLLARGLTADDGVRVRASPLSMFSGDVVLSRKRPASQGVRWMLGDVSGHGLSGAIGTIPLATLFYHATDSGTALDDMVADMNRELHAALPRRFFCAAIAMELDAPRRWLSVINAGMPPGLLVRADGSTCELTSRNLPLGIDPRVELAVQRVAVMPGDRVYCLSDGVPEAEGPDGAPFGMDRAAAALSSLPRDRAFDTLLSRLECHSRGTLRDDTTLLEVVV